jgi:hypothetical protein
LRWALREVVLEEVPDACESICQVYTVAIWFGFSGKMKDMFCQPKMLAERIPPGKGKNARRRSSSNGHASAAAEALFVARSKRHSRSIHSAKRRPSMPPWLRSALGIAMASAGVGRSIGRMLRSAGLP